MSANQFWLKQKFGFIKQVDKGWITTVKDLEKSFQIFHGGNSTFNNLFDKTKFLFRSLPPTQHRSFFRN